MATPRVRTSPWAALRGRAELLRVQHPFAAQQLRLYLALLDVWEDAWARARDVPPAELAGWAAREVFPAVLAATVAHGPKPLADSVSGADGEVAALLAAWLAGEGLEPTERYLARATLRGPLAAVDAGDACAADPAPRGDRRCPHCAGPPQLSVRLDSGDPLVAGRRELACARCAARWDYSGN
ncbi:MAG TPA: hypothetical protein VFT95_03035, partial [Micromonosporaceae bacterium]|nr:hypothetical protein [Micromonosporaceae bacterium]